MSQQDLPLTFNQMGQACCRCQGYEVKRHLQGLFEARTELIELPAPACETEPELNSLSIDRKCTRTRKECVFYFRPVFSFAGREMELLLMSKILQDFRIRYQRRDAFWGNISINNRVNQCRAKIAPPSVARPFQAP